MKTVVLLCSMGGPENLDAVEPFLFNLFNDPSILRLPWFIRRPLARWIARKRAPAAKEIYARMGGKSPLLDNTRDQAKALENELSLYGDYRCVVAMSYAPPLIDQAMADIVAMRPDMLVVLPMYPQYSTATTASVFREIKRFLKINKIKTPVHWIRSFEMMDGFIEAMSDLTAAACVRAKGKGALRILLSAHGLPMSYVKRGDPYPFLCHQTATAILEALSLRWSDWELCYQSRVGPMRWLTPSTEDEVRKAAKENKAIIIIPISFVCEHAETCVELKEEYEALAKDNGCPHYEVVSTVSTHPAFIKGLVKIITKN